MLVCCHNRHFNFLSAAAAVLNNHFTRDFLSKNKLYKSKNDLKKGICMNSVHLFLNFSCKPQDHFRTEIMLKYRTYVFHETKDHHFSTQVGMVLTKLICICLTMSQDTALPTWLHMLPTKFKVGPHQSHHYSPVDAFDRWLHTECSTKVWSDCADVSAYLCLRLRTCNLVETVLPQLIKNITQPWSRRRYIHRAIFFYLSVFASTICIFPSPQLVLSAAKP